MPEYMSNSHTISRLNAHIVWITKYCYHVLHGDIQKRCRDLIIQICNSENVTILKGVVSKDHVHIHVESPLLKYKCFSEKVERSQFSSFATGIFFVEGTILGSTFLGC